MTIKKSTVLALLLFSLMIACQSTDQNKGSRSLSQKGPLESEARPDLTKAYFYGEFGDQYNKLVDSAILFKNYDLDQTINFKIREGSQFRLYEVEPGSYANDFGYYLWDVFYWNQKGIYQVKPVFKKKFIARPGEIYYIGSFNSIGFTFDFEKHIDRLLNHFIYFKDLPIHKAYNQE